MKIKVIDNFAHRTGSFVQGREYEVNDVLAAEWIKGNIAAAVEAKPVEEEKKTKAKAE